MKPGIHGYFIPRIPLLLLAVAMIFTVPAMIGNLVAWVPCAFLGALVVKILMEWRGARLRSWSLKLLLMGAGVGAVTLSYHTLLGPEPGLSMCLVLIGVKILEAHTARDFHVLAALGWFACLAQIMISQSLNFSICSGIAFVIVLMAVLLFHRRSSAPRGLLLPLRDTLFLVLQAAPLVLVLFVLFPRGNGSLGFFQPRSFSGQTGMSDTLTPGSVAALALTKNVAFRVSFPEGGMPAPSGMYWRGGVLTKADGMSWRAAKPDLQWQAPVPVEGKAIRQRIVLQPHGGRWIFALDKPMQPPRGMLFGEGEVLVSKEVVRNTLQYDVFSLPNKAPEPLTPIQRKICLQLTAVSPSVRALVQSWQKNVTEPAGIVAVALDFFQKGRFSYTLTPGVYGPNALDEFLFRRRAGFCEHYAAAFATLMRAAGVPARIVIGYQGGEFNGLGKYLIVRQSYAHAWCEVWLPESGWKRVDPTAVVTPSRVNLDSAAGPGSDLGNAVARELRQRGILHELQLAWDTLSYEWDSRVAGFDEDAQQTLFIQHGLLGVMPMALFNWILVACALLIALQWGVSWWKARPNRDPLVTLYERFCHRAAFLGAKRAPSEGPLHFSTRATELIPAQAGRIRRITVLYTQLRYSADPDTTGAQAELAREIKLFCGTR